MKSPITTHVLDTAIGRPAKGVGVVLEKRVGDAAFDAIAEGTTDDDGRVTDLLSAPLTGGTYRLTFLVGDYLTATGREGFYPEVPVVFTITEPDEHYHVPLLLNPFGYSTYRGS